MGRPCDRRGAGRRLAARQSAILGLKTLLIDKSPFPRAKVCGGCISGLGRHVLERVGLGHLVEEPAATPLDRFDLAAAGKRVSLALPLGAAISRYHFDAALVREAVAAGAEFLSETTAQVRGRVDAWRLRGVLLQGLSRGTVRAQPAGAGCRRPRPYKPATARPLRSAGRSGLESRPECHGPRWRMRPASGNGFHVGRPGGLRRHGARFQTAASTSPPLSIRTPCGSGGRLSWFVRSSLKRASKRRGP